MSESETTEAPVADAPKAQIQNHLYLVDGSSYIFRAYHRLPPLTNRHGMNVGAVYGYTTMLWKLADGLSKADGPTHMAVILDASEQTFRNELYDRIRRTGRRRPRTSSRNSPDPHRDPGLLDPVHRKGGLEADDIIACYDRGDEAGWKVTIVSSDKDLMQLIDEAAVDMLDTMNDRRIGPSRCWRSSACRRRRSATCSR